MSERLKIIDYFDSLVDEIDIRAENLLVLVEQPHLHDVINERRKLFILQVETLKKFNLANLDDGVQFNDNSKLLQKHCFLVDFNNGRSHDGAHLSSEDLIDRTLGYLIVLDGFLTKRKLTLYKELISFNESFNNCDSNIFNTIKYKHSDLSKAVSVTMSIFDQSDSFIIHTNEADLFRVECLYLFGTLVESVKPEAMELFFKTPIRMEIHDSLESTSDLQRLVNVSKWFGSNLSVQHMTLRVESAMDFKLCQLSNVANLNELQLECKLTGVDSFDMGRAANLKRFTLGSYLSRIGKKAFSNWRMLTQVDLSANKIDLIEPTAFDRMFNLIDLNLSGNKIKIIHTSLFKDLHNLVSLNLSFNLLDKINQTTFENLGNLKNLNLSHNRIEYLSGRMFDGLDNIEYLNLSSNKIRHLDSTTFSRLFHIKHLDLSNNKMDSLPDLDFKSLKSA